MTTGGGTQWDPGDPEYTYEERKPRKKKMAKGRKTMADNLREEIEVLTGRVAEAQAKADLWNERLFDAQTELDRAQNALAALEGTAPPASSKKTYPSVKMPLVDAVSIESRRGKGQLNITESPEELSPAAAPIIAPNKPNRIMFNGVEIELEPGFRVGKNSFGEDVLIPAGMPDLLPMQEPTEVRKPEFSLPAAGDFPDLPSTGSLVDPRNL